MATARTGAAGLRRLGHTEGSTLAAMRHNAKPIYGIQFHPEVRTRPTARRCSRIFCFASPGFGDWTMRSFVETSLESIRHRVGDAGVLMGLSGGVDSSVARASSARRSATS